MGRVRASIHSVQLPFVSVSLYHLQKKKIAKRSTMVTLNDLLFERVPRNITEKYKRKHRYLRTRVSTT